jgi:hypothetical protein
LFGVGDRVYDNGQVVIWKNTAHDGYFDPVNKPNEIFTLQQLGILYIDVTNYRQAHQCDGHNNCVTWVSTVQAPGHNNYQVYDVTPDQ